MDAGRWPWVAVLVNRLIVRHHPPRPVRAVSPARCIALGLGLGALFPLIAWILDLIFHGHTWSLSALWEIHLENPVLWIVDLAPLVSGGVGALVGLTQRRLVETVEQWTAASTQAASERRFEALVRHSSDLILVVDATGLIGYASPASEWVLGYAPEALIGGELYPLLHPEDEPDLRAGFARAVGSIGPAQPLTARWRHRGGAWRVIEATASRSQDEASPGHLIVVLHDVTDQQRATTALRESERLYRAVVDTASEVIFQTDTSGRWALLNPAWTALTGFTIAESLGTSCLHYVHSADRQAARLAFRQLAERQIDHLRQVTRLVTHDGQERWFEWRAALAMATDGTVLGVAGTLTDMTERQAAEARRARDERHLALRAEIINILASREPLATILRRCARALMSHLGGTGAGVWTVAANEPVLELQAWAGDGLPSDDLWRRVPIDHSSIGRVAHDRQPYVTTGLPPGLAGGAEDGETEPTAETMAGLPLLVGERLVGMIAVFTRQPITPDTLAVLDGLADLLAQGIQRTRAEEALHRAEEHLRAVMASAPMILFALDRDGIVTFCDGAGTAALNRPGPAFVGQSVFELYVNQPEVLDGIRRALLGEDLNLLVPFGPIIFETRARPVRDAQGQIIGMAGVGLDVSERVRAEATERFLTAASETLASSLDYRTTLTTLAHLIIPFLADACIIDLIEADGMPHRLVVTHRDPAMVERIEELRHRYPVVPGGEHPVARVLATGQSVLVPALTEAAIRAVRDEDAFVADLRALGYRSNIAVPLVARGVLLGVLQLLILESERLYEPADLALAEELARRAAQGIDNARLYAAEQAARAAAEAAARRTALLQGITAALSAALTPTQVAEVIVTQAATALEAIAGGVSLSTAGSLATRTIHMAGTSLGELEIWQAFQPDGQRAVVEMVRAGELVVLESLADLLRERPELAARLPELADGALVVIPLQVDGHVIGGLGLRLAQARHFDDENRAFLLTLGRHCAQALERARLSAAEQAAYQAAARRARQEVAVAAQRTLRLQAITAALGELLTPNQVATLILEQGAVALPARSGSVLLLDEGGGSLTMLATHDGRLPAFGQARRLIIADPGPLAEAMRANVAVWLEAGSPRRRSMITPVGESVALSDDPTAILPLTIQGRVIGLLMITHAAELPFGDQERDFLLVLARLCAQALERAQLYEADQRARAAVEAAHRRAAFLAEASALLAGSLDYEVTLNQVCALALPFMGDACVIDLVGEAGEVRQIAVAPDDPILAERILQVRQRYPLDLAGGHPVARVMREGVSLIVPIVSEPYVLEVGRDAQHQDMIRGFGLRSLLCVPLLARERTLGTLSFLTSASDRQFGADDLALAEELARRAAQAIDNAQLYQRAQEALLALRRSHERLAQIGLTSAIDLRAIGQ